MHVLMKRVKSLLILFCLTVKYIKILGTEIGRGAILTFVIKHLGREGKKVTKENIPGKHLFPKDSIRNCSTLNFFFRELFLLSFIMVSFIELELQLLSM